GVVGCQRVQAGGCEVDAVDVDHRVQQLGGDFVPDVQPQRGSGFCRANGHSVDHAHRHDGGVGDRLTMVGELVGVAVDHRDGHLGVVKGRHDFSFAHDIMGAGGQL